jgi:hypothetical protein
VGEIPGTPFLGLLTATWPRPHNYGKSNLAETAITGEPMSERPDYVIACHEIGAVMYPDAGQKLFVSLPGGFLRELGRQLQEFADQHPDVMSWQPVEFKPQ